MKREMIPIGSLEDICRVFDDHWENIRLLKTSARKTRTGLTIAFVSGLIFGIFAELRIRNLEHRMDHTYETTSMQNQLDLQEQKILQLELELEELKKKE